MKMKEISAEIRLAAMKAAQDDTRLNPYSVSRLVDEAIAMERQIPITKERCEKQIVRREKYYEKVKDDLSLARAHLYREMLNHGYYEDATR